MKMPRLTAVEPAGTPFHLTVTWEDETVSLIDLSGAIHSNRVLSALTAPGLFETVRLGEWGWSIAWSDEIDLGADSLWRMAGEQAGDIMPAASFQAWRERNRLSLTGAAAALGLSRRTVAYYDSGARLIPKTVMLATIGFEAQGQHAA